MAGWTITGLQGGGHIVTYLDDDTGEESLAGTFGLAVGLEEIVNMVLDAAEIADWVILPTGEVLVVAERPDDDS